MVMCTGTVEKFVGCRVAYAHHLEIMLTQQPAAELVARLSFNVPHTLLS